MDVEFLVDVDDLGDRVAKRQGGQGQNILRQSEEGWSLDQVC